MNIKVSIIIPTYNREKLLQNAVKSVLNQTYQSWELLIVDDGSVDSTKEVAMDYCKRDARIQYFYKENGGQGSARNFGIRRANGQYVLCLDSDDILLKDAIADLVNCIQEKDADIVTCQKWMCSLESKIIENVSEPNPSCTLFKKNLFNEFCYYNETREFIGVEDSDLEFQWQMLSASQHIPIYRISLSVPMVIYFQHGGQFTNYGNVSHLEKSTIVMIEKYKNNKFIPKNWVAIKYRGLANFEMFSKNTKTAKKYFRKSLSLYFMMSTFILFIISLFGSRVYRVFVFLSKTIREFFVYRVKTLFYADKYSSFYKEAVSQLSNLQAAI